MSLRRMMSQFLRAKIFRSNFMFSDHIQPEEIGLNLPNDLIVGPIIDLGNMYLVSIKVSDPRSKRYLERGSDFTFKGIPIIYVGV